MRGENNRETWGKPKHAVPQKPKGERDDTVQSALVKTGSELSPPRIQQ